MKNKKLVFIIPVIALAVICFIISGLFGCALMSEAPEYGTKEYIIKKYGSLIQSVEGCIKNSNTLFSLAAELEKLNYPENLIYVGLEKPNADYNDKPVDVIKKYEWNNFSMSSSYGYGHGTLDDKKISIIEIQAENIKDVECCIIYLEHIPGKDLAG